MAKHLRSSNDSFSASKDEYLSASCGQVYRDTEDIFPDPLLVGRESTGKKDNLG